MLQTYKTAWVRVSYKNNRWTFQKTLLPLKIRSLMRKCFFSKCKCIYWGAFARMVNYCNNGLPGGTETQSACPSHFKLVFTIGRPSLSRRKSQMRCLSSRVNKISFNIIHLYSLCWKLSHYSFSMSVLLYLWWDHCSSTQREIPL